MASDTAVTPDDPATGRVLLPVDVGQLRRVHDGRWAEARDQTRELLRRPEMAPGSGDPEAARRRVWQQLQLVATTAGPSLGFPSGVGGADDVGGSISSFSLLAYRDLSLLVKAGVQWGLFGGAILHLGTAGHHERYLRDVISLRLPGCFAMTETGHGSDVQSVRTRATFDPEREGFVVHTPDLAAEKNYIGNAAVDGRMAVVFAQLETGGEEHGVHAFMVPIRDEHGRPAPGVTITDCGLKEGLNGVDNGRLRFDHVVVDRHALLNRYADVDADGTYHSPIEGQTKRFFTMLGTLIQGRISVAGGALHATKVALAIAVRYGEARRQFAAPGSDEEIVILDYLAHQRRLIPALASTWALHLAHERLVADLDRVQRGGGDDDDQRRLETRAAGLKAVATWHAAATIQACREACGGAGYLAENQLPRLRADIDVFTTFEGDNTVLLQLVGKELLSGYRSDFEDRDLLATIRFAADQAWDVVVEAVGARDVAGRLLAVVPGRDDEEDDVRGREWLREQFAWREKHLLDTLARRLRRAVDADDPFAVFNQAQDHLLEAAEASVERQALDDASEAVTSVDDPPTAALLEAGVELFALSRLERHRAWYLEHGRISANQAKAVRKAVNDACGELRPLARTLVDGFGIPEEALTAPIAG